jgi:hypothetical protein
MDCGVAEIVMGMRVERVFPPWYHDGAIEVSCFYEPNNPLMIYSWDKNACNARMCRNGQNECDGTAESLPFYTADPAAMMDVLERMAQLGYWAVLHYNHTDDFVKHFCVCEFTKPGHEPSAAAPTLPWAVALAALVALDSQREWT